MMPGKKPDSVLVRRTLSRRQTLELALTATVGGLAGCQAKQTPETTRAPAGDPGGSHPAAARARIERVIPAVGKREGQGAFVHRLFPTRHLRDLDPFVLLDDFNVREPAGFPDHPHRGFEAFTYMLEGAFHHKDNLGNDSVVGAGGSQRFTSGRGARHSEMPAGAGDNRGLQLWVNLPRRLKQMTPSYAPVNGPDVFEEHVAGVYRREVVGPESQAQLQTAVDYQDLTLERGRRFGRTILEGYNTVIYVISGAVRLFDHTLQAQRAALTSPGDLEFEALEFSRVLFLSGKPHGQPIIQNGPFVD